MLNRANWSPALEAIYQKKHPDGLAHPSLDVPPRQPVPVSPSHPGEMLGQQALGQPDGPLMGMGMSSPVSPRPQTPAPRPHMPAFMRFRRKASPTPAPQSLIPSQAVSTPDPGATTDKNAQAVLSPPTDKTRYSTLHGQFQKIDADKGYTDDLSTFEPIFQQWKDYYARTGKPFIQTYNQWPQRMKDYFTAWRGQHSGTGVEADPNAPPSGLSFFQEMDDYFKKLKLAQRDDPNYVPAGGAPGQGGPANIRHDIPGIYPEAMLNYKASKFKPDEQKFMTQEITPSIQTHRTVQQASQAIADDLSGGDYDVGDLMSPGLEAQTTGKPDATVYDPVLKQAMDRVIERYDRDIMPSIADQAQAYGQYGGARQGVAEGLAAQGLEKTLGEMSARMNLEAYKEAQSKVIPATQARAGLKKATLQDRLSNREKALMQRSARTQEADDYIDRMLKYWRHGTDVDADALKRYLGMLQLGSPGPSTTQTQPQFRNKKAEWLGMLGALGSLGSMF